MMTSAAKSASKKRSVQAAETRERLVVAAVKLFSDKSYEEVSVADIAKAAGVAHGLLFHYFGSKRGIHLAAMRLASEQLHAGYVADSALPPVAQLREGLAANLRFLAAHRNLALRLILAGRGGDSEVWKVFEAGRVRSMERAATILDLPMDNAALQMVGRATVGAIDEATVFWLTNDQPFDLDRMVDSFIELFADGLRWAHRLDPSLNLGAAAAALAGKSGMTGQRPPRAPNPESSGG